MSRTHLAIALAATLVTFPIAAARAQNPPAQTPPAGVAQLPPPADSLSLAVRPGDVVRIVVWGHPELSGEFPIDENYNLLFPLIGPIDVRPLSVVQLRARRRAGARRGRQRQDRQRRGDGLQGIDLLRRRKAGRGHRA